MGVGQRRRDVPPARVRPDEFLRVEEALSDPGVRRSQGPTVDPQEPAADDAARDRGAHQGAGPGAAGLWLQSPQGAAGAGRPERIVDHSAEDSQRQRPSHTPRPLAGVGEGSGRQGT